MRADAETQAESLWRDTLMWLTGAFQFGLIAYVHIKVTHRTDVPMLFGDRTEATFDLWSIQHFASDVIMGAIVVAYNKRPLWRTVRSIDIIYRLFIIAIWWEFAELMMESGTFGPAIAHWKHGFEHWSNRFVGDPLMVVLGGVVAKKFPSTGKWAWALTLVWLASNILAPHSMWVQEYLIGP